MLIGISTWRVQQLIELTRLISFVFVMPSDPCTGIVTTSRHISAINVALSISSPTTYPFSEKFHAVFVRFLERVGSLLY